MSLKEFEERHNANGLEILVEDGPGSSQDDLLLSRHPPVFLILQKIVTPSASTYQAQQVHVPLEFYTRLIGFLINHWKTIKWLAFLLEP